MMVLGKDGEEYTASLEGGGNMGLRKSMTIDMVVRHFSDTC